MADRAFKEKSFFAFPTLMIGGIVLSLLLFSIPPSIIALVLWQTDLQEIVKILTYIALLFVFDAFGVLWLFFTDACTKIVIRDGKILQKRGRKVTGSFLTDEIVHTEKRFFGKIKGYILCIYYVGKTTEEKKLKQLQYGNFIKYEGCIVMEYTRKREKLFDDLRAGQ